MAKDKIRLTTTEIRFRDGEGERYLKNGNIRCQAVSKTRLHRLRLERDDFDSPPEAFWPEAQCEKPAMPGVFVCHFHGGRSPRYKAPRGIFDVLPVDLRRNFQVMLDNPDYISRKDDILLTKTRQWQLLEQLTEQVGSEAAWEMVYTAAQLLRSNEVAEALALLEQAIETTKTEKEVWKEVYQTQAVLKDLTNTEMKSAKELRLMVTSEQVMVLVNNIYAAITEGAEKYIKETEAQSGFLRFISDKFTRFVNLSPSAAFPKLIEGSTKQDGEAE